MNRNHLLLIGVVLLTLPLLWLFVPESKPGTISSLDGVTLSNLNGQKFKLSGLMADKKLLLVFWSITCGTCIEEIPFVIGLHEKLGDRLTVIGVHPPGYPLAKVQKFLRKYPQKIPYLIAIDDGMQLSRSYEVTVLPKTVLLDMRGNVLYSHVGYDPSMEAEIEGAIRSKL
ncbi:MAG TPA: TlpA disulfide reductase family protein [Candidatus Ozemobacteraceae bacterium]